jgi:hypothetical protein
MACDKVISKDRYYCYGCFNALEEKVYSQGDEQE